MTDGELLEFVAWVSLALLGVAAINALRGAYVLAAVNVLPVVAVYGLLSPAPPWRH